MLLRILQWLEATSFSTNLRESVYAWAVVNGTHVIGLALFLGLMLFVDLRLLSVRLTSVPTAEVWRRLSPWVFAGFALMAVTGALLFVSDPVRFWGNIFFRIKVVALALAGLNALAFHYGIGQRLGEWGTAGATPAAARVAGGVSLALWVAIVVCGRLIAYNWFEPLV